MSSWAAIQDPVERLQVALRALYAYYDRVAPMLGNVLRDAETVPAVWQATEPRRRYIADVRDLLARGWSARGRQRQRLSAALALSLDFHTWKRLVRDEEVDPEDAVHMMICLIRRCVSRARFCRTDIGAVPPITNESSPSGSMDSSDSNNDSTSAQDP